ncbi:LPXTG cell wall anchor domain-containing protein [Mesorhizobium sp. B2-6-6]|nr:LPXTG cell wall anchor domain-containing protein [Mesorhizobium sp. B3-1-1]TPJ50381.1 LPXTG cell wall anchor domain-containing protein [Mesorhizobium sp. B2-6-6]TPJ55931.1 LPXTG cell wall anchor domain-containing protein [Mesorhizobium sp. B2-6-4]TPJ67425.1 LPXTG cell wall anchor domain-containing protein [Mesorhizobium sp. B2-6-1]TPJ68101.1 LPXTG cell wall anchor domain-containing protein [Mesorhizobium sp. B2-6-7]TPJ87814.1 LPXTG cell wall anchor domain-containing protein [Mesorhizobium s
MTGQSQWLTIGIIVMLVGLAGLVWANRSRG